ncbi:MAG TPA: hypothetical protein VKM94_23860, partial [Blastocatellia bacterium]|nr:hypothetical protein [Blastocatellia bacterium]
AKNREVEWAEDASQQLLLGKRFLDHSSSGLSGDCCQGLLALYFQVSGVRFLLVRYGLLTSPDAFTI